MNAQTKKAIAYLKDNYGLHPNDLDLSGEFDIKEIERLAGKFGLTKIETFRTKMTVEQAIKFVNNIVK